MKEILIFLAGSFFGKLINDNLPDLNYKSIKAFSEKMWHKLVWWFAITIFPLLIKWRIITLNKEQSQKFAIMLFFCLLVIIVAFFIEQEKKNKNLI
ncbi:MAG: hypothetical protein H0V01_01210 [Bacteroidetes bacterium]|nr:hypothetical protein [Bacteroidota bacterium]